MIAQQDPHEAEVRRIAKILATTEFTIGDLERLNISNSCSDAWDIVVDRNMYKARVMVAEMAKQFAEGFNSVYDFTNDPEFGPIIKQQQIERGLIPSPTKDIEK